jgi:hypothetical protein
MATKDKIQDYYDRLRQKRDWESFFSEGMVFVNNGKEIQDKSSYLEGAKRFFFAVQSLEVLELLVEGEKASAVVRYDIKAPNGNNFKSDIAEFFGVKNGKFDMFAIYFDTAPYA